VLPGISTEQLRSRLNRMVADGMLTRKRYREVPPRVDYELTERARDLMPILGELARWGYEWAWSPPRSAETVDVGSIFRLAPGLVRPGGGLTGSVELIVDDATADGDGTSYSLVMAGDSVSIEERVADGADARISGSIHSWIRAFSPDGDRDGLEIRGDRRLADSLLDALGTTARAMPAEDARRSGRLAAGRPRATVYLRPGGGTGQTRSS
jgi:HxlR-like helix-turn-helix